MMKRLQCTYSQLQDEPALEMAVFEAFAAGEAAEESAQRQADRDKERVVQR